MSAKQKKPRAPRHKNRKLEAILEIANAYIVQHFPFGCMGGQPHRLVLPTGELWIVPIVLTSPGYGPVSEVGLVGVQGKTPQVVGASQKLEVSAAIKHWKENKRHELQAAFHRARKA